MEDDFDFTNKDLKHYPYFDAPLTLRDIRHLVTSPDRVATNTFYPLFQYLDTWQPFRSADAAKPKPKERLIRYVRDSTISRFFGKVAGAAKRDGRRHVAANPAMDAGYLISAFYFSLFSQRFSRVKKSHLTDDYPDRNGKAERHRSKRLAG